MAKAKQQPKKEQAPKAPGTKSEAPPRLLSVYRDTVMQQLTKEFDYANVMQVPRVDKVVVNIGIGEAKDNDKALDAAVGDVVTITGQKPQLIKAKKSVAAFKLRAGQTVGIKTTLRGRRMWYFLDKLLNVALPRIRDFRGVNPEGFDGRGNYSLGMREQVVFPEIDYDKIDKLRGLEVSIITTARNDEEARSLLTRLGMPFRKR
ncbi:MAG: 50S ribosomal protein L5 [Chloroflexi bacterium]|nr:MAG: 50S ribosomal protein L5 [Chloroflexota bacterium]TME39313.1 MAG: 50S ribosomal protein L5 [Chloroflexota bacterium]TME52297.1 MAG: 50S ribosomal protein L5 [Chloroflexota bacterium]